MHEVMFMGILKMASFSWFKKIGNVRFLDPVLISEQEIIVCNGMHCCCMFIFENLQTIIYMQARQPLCMKLYSWEYYKIASFSWF